MEKVIEAAERSSGDLARICSELVRFNTVNPPGQVRECIDYIDTYFRDLGVETEIYEREPGKANVVARIPGKLKSKILYLGHIDVVTEGTPELWKHEPFGGEISEGRVWGRGSTDMKGSDASAMVAAKILLEVDEGERSTMEFWFTTDEEYSLKCGAKWLAETGRFKGDLCVVGDAFDSTPEKPTVDVGAKKALRPTIKVGGKTAHGSTPFYGENAIEKLIRALDYGRKITDFKLDVPEDLEPVVQSSIAFTLDDPSLTEGQIAAIRRQYDYPTFSLNLFHGGKKVNVVPDYAEASIDMRLTPGANYEDVKKRFEDLVTQSGVEDVKVEWYEGGGFYDPPDSKALVVLGEAIERALGVKPILKIMWGGTDGYFTKTVSGIPSPAFGAGVKGMAHAPDEYVTIENMVMTAKVYAVLPLIYEKI